MIDFENVTRTYGRRVAVSDLTLRVGRGELFALLGPNGAGKTTAMKMLVGLLRPSVGVVRVCGHNVAADPQAAARCVGYVPDEAFLYDKLSGREFLEFVGEMRGLDQPSLAARVEAMCDTFGLGDFVDDLAETYSHGMKQRLVFAAAVLHDPQVLIVDEPMVGLDPLSTRMVKDMLCRRAAAGKTVFMSTHTLAVAEEIAHRIAILDCGHLNFLGTVGQLKQELASPESTLEAMFLERTGGGETAQGRQVRKAD
jgi:ABC-2 type transport system ATP-binding protein